MSKRKALPQLGALAQSINAHKPSATTAKRPGRTMLAVSPEVAERVRDAAYHERDTVKAIVERALLAEVERMEFEHGEGFVFPSRKTSAR